MTTPRIRVMVGEGRSTRKDLLRFVLENEGYDVVAEAASTLELAQKIAVHRPDVVVLDDGIDASAVGMLREVLPSAKVILVWPRGVTAVGADARLEPDEVMTSLGSTIARVVGRGSVIAPPRPRVTPPDVIVVPEPEELPPVEAPAEPPVPGSSVEEQAPVVSPVEAAVETPAEMPESESATELITVVPERLSGVMMEPSSLEAPRWTYASSGASRTTARRRRVATLLLAAAALLLAVVVGIVLLGGATVGIRSLSGSVGSFVLPGNEGTGNEVTTDQPGTYHGLIRVSASGLVHLSATGDLHLRVMGPMRLIAHGDVDVHGDGVVKTVLGSGIRVRGHGTIRVIIHDGRIRMSLQGWLSLLGQGTVRIGGNGQFLIAHHPI